MTGKPWLLLGDSAPGMRRGSIE